MYEKDYIKRIIEQIADFLTRLSGIKTKGQHEEALELIDDALGEILGLDVRLLRMMDANSIAEMLPDNDHLLVYLKLELEEIDILRQVDQEQRANRLLHLIREVAGACTAKHGGPDDELVEIIAGLDGRG